jgi:sec-independent protein translocase protein TatB
MFEVGFTEIVLIFAIALLVLGPSRLPRLAADVGRWAGRARAMARQLRTQLEQEVHYDPLKDTHRPERTIHTPAPAPDAPDAPAAPDEARASTPSESTPEPGAAPDRTDESRPA